MDGEFRPCLFAAVSLAVLDSLLPEGAPTGPIFLGRIEVYPLVLSWRCLCRPYSAAP